MRCVILGVIDLHQLKDPYRKLHHIFERVCALVDEYGPHEVALESPFFGNNVQSMLKLGRAKEQVAAILKSMLKLEELPKRLDATDGLAVAVCHHFQCSVIARVDPSPLKKALGGGRTASKSWTEFISSHPDRVKGDK